MIKAPRTHPSYLYDMLIILLVSQVVFFPCSVSGKSIKPRHINRRTEMPFVSANGRIILRDVYVDGYGRQIFLLSDSYAETILDSRQGKRTQIVHADISFGGNRFSGNVRTMELRSMADSLGTPRLDGIIGRDIISRYNRHVKWSEGTLILIYGGRRMFIAKRTNTESQPDTGRISISRGMMQVHHI